MESIREIYRIGHGPSSSHTMGPKTAAQRFLEQHPTTSHFRVTLYGSLAATGKGHLTDRAILDTFAGRQTDLIWEPKVFLPRHPNAMKFEALDANGQPADAWTVYSVGGGAIIDDTTTIASTQVYPHHRMEQILAVCHAGGIHFGEYIHQHEGPALWPYLAEVWQVMQASMQRGLNNDESLPGGLKLARKALSFNLNSRIIVTRKADPRRTSGRVPPVVS